ncbi:hypothetical protein LTR86_006323 [Recurvomyces mirabilis]|nr:hypothetical protein LTR86_006323 [Recurvomyces mirabilis]
MLQTPRGHVRQRSTASIGPYEAEKKDIAAEEPLLEDELTIHVPTKRLPVDRPVAILWGASLILTALITYLISSRTNSGEPGAFAKGYATELESAKSAIEVVVTQFTGSLDFKGKHGFIPLDSPSQKYVGSTTDVDAAWSELVDDRYFLLTDKEAHNAYGDDIETTWNVHHGGYVAGLDVLHTLHCLNQLRMSLYPRIYPQDPEHGVMHKAHCLDHLRQLAMCNVGLTPVPTQWFPGLGQNYINSSREHTCRDFWQVRDWATERFNGSTAVKPRNRDGKIRSGFQQWWC